VITKRTDDRWSTDGQRTDTGADLQDELRITTRSFERSWLTVGLPFDRYSPNPKPDGRLTTDQERTRRGDQPGMRIAFITVSRAGVRSCVPRRRRPQRKQRRRRRRQRHQFRELLSIAAVDASWRQSTPLTRPAPHTHTATYGQRGH